MAGSLGLFCQRFAPTNRDHYLRKNLAALLDILDLLKSESAPPGQLVYQTGIGCTILLFK